MGIVKVMTKKGSKEVRTATVEKQRVTVGLGASADGTKIKPIIVIKGERVPARLQNKVEGLNMVVIAQRKAWMDAKGMQTWIDQCLKEHPSVRAQRDTVLYMDNFGAHKTQEVQAAIRQLHCEPQFFPPNSSHLLQPLDGGPNRSFKSTMRRLWATHFEKHRLKGGGKMKMPPLEEVLQWIVWAWEEVSAETIKSSFHRMARPSAIQDADESENATTESTGPDVILNAESHEYGVVSGQTCESPPANDEQCADAITENNPDPSDNSITENYPNLTDEIDESANPEDEPYLEEAEIDYGDESS